MKQINGLKGSGTKSILLIFLIVLLILPGLQSKYGLIHEKVLTGAFKAPEDSTLKEFTFNSWFNGSFQDENNKYLEQHIGFRNYLIRFNNQINFTLFKQTNAEGVIVGQKSELFEEDYIKEYVGQYYIGDSVWLQKAKKLKAVQDTLSRLGKSLVVIFEPDKASFYPELLPSKYGDLKKSVSNYDEFSKQLKVAGVNVLDLNQYFISIKGKSEYPLFAKCGTHWSYYGSVLAADTTLKYLESLLRVDLPDMRIVRNEVPDIPRHPDYDIGLALNLMYPIPQPKTANPILGFMKGPGKTRPHVLVVGDSFYFNWLNNHIPAETFSSCDFWYYNKNIIRSDGSKAGVASDLDLRSEVMKRDVIMIMVTGRFMHAFSWGFDEQLYDLYYPGNQDPIEHFANQIRCYGDEFQRMYKESVNMNISLADRIRKDAEYLYYADLKKNPDKYTSKSDIILSYEMGIRGTPEWMKEIKRKAKVNKISVDEQIHLDAEWIYEDKYGKKK